MKISLPDVNILLALVAAGHIHHVRARVQRAIEISDELLSDRRVSFEYEPPGLETAWTAMMRHPAATASSWTDAYLAAFAQQHDYGMATFDRGFQRWSDLKLGLLAGI